jgi:hypothetical protein
MSFFFFFCDTGIELRTSCFEAGTVPFEPCPSPFLHFSDFPHNPIALDHNPPTSTSRIAGITAVHHYIWLVVEMGSH